MFRLLLALSLLAAGALHAQERPRAILVLDASGSMWGQIDGVNKIVIAREVIGGLLKEIPPDQELGLTAYGHRRKGDCSDIETLIEPGLGQLDAIADAVNRIKPKGKTPLSAAVIQAAEALRYTEERATVILVSDGKETCDFDPCEVGRTLEEAGVDFTAHVIGFDVSDPADRAQLQCLAEETGGMFRTASNAGELAEALQVMAEQVMAEPPALPEPTLFDVTFNAKDGAGGPTLTKGLVWSVRDAAGEVLLQGGNDMTPTLELVPGNFSASVLREVDGATAERDFTIEGHRTVVLVLPELPPEPRTVHYRATEGDGGDLIRDQLVWDIYGEDGTPILETEVVASGRIELLPGNYRVEVLRPEDESTATKEFTVKNSNQTVVLVLPEIVQMATVSGPATAVAGSLVQVTWEGPNEHNDYIAVAPVGSTGGTWDEYTYTNEGTPLNLRMPAVAGDFEIRYVLSEGREVIGRQAVTVTPVKATIDTPESLPAGATVSVGWTGPDYKNDYLAVVKPGEDGWINYVYTREGTPAALLLPGEPGDYEIIYTMNQDRHTIARVPITVTGVDFSVSVPATAAAGSSIEVTWTGPDYKNDFIAITLPDAEEGNWINYTYTKEGSPLKLPTPLEPGTYQVRYVLSQDRMVMARAEIELTPVTGAVSGPATAKAGAQVQVTWEGPSYKNDYITIARTDGDANDYEYYTYTKKGSPLSLQMPTRPGVYELRYVAQGRDDKILARQPITVEAVEAMLEANASAAPGSNLVVTWTGPDYRNDYLAISRADDPDGYESYTYTRDGSPLIVKVPERPGAYELRYIMGQDRSILLRRPLTVE